MNGNSEDMKEWTTLLFYVNGRRIEEKKADPKTTLATYLRDHLHLTGTKIGCNEGGCGACTVMISEIHPLTEKIVHYSANACLMPLCMLFGKAVTTVEGIGNVKKMHPVQERMALCHGSQCGFCTPGFVMAMYSLLRNHPKPTKEQVDESIQGNLCRCTGYRPILDAFYSFCSTDNGNKSNNVEIRVNDQLHGVENGRIVNGCGMGDKCCKNKKNQDENTKTQLTDLSKVKDYDETQEPIFPPEIQIKHLHKQRFFYTHDTTKWYQPVTIKDLLNLKKEMPHARLISGNSELAIELKFRFIELTNVINPKQVKELRETVLEKDCIVCGTGLSLTEMDNKLEEYRRKLDRDQFPVKVTGVLKEVHEMIHWFAGKHVRNVASVAGNIATASPISDLNPIWMAANAKAILESEERGQRRVSIDEKFFIGYRKTIIEPDEIIRAVCVPLTGKHQYFRAYKQAQRREDDIAIVTAAFNLKINEEAHTIEEIRMAFGGVAPVTKLGLQTMAIMKGKKWNQETLETALDSLSKEFALPPGVPGGMEAYRTALVLSFFYKFYLHVENQLSNIHEDETEMSGHMEVSTTQAYTEKDPDEPIGRPLMHVSGQKHTTGEAIYNDDFEVGGCLHLAFVLSPIGKGHLVSVDYAKALEMEGVVGCIDAHDVEKGKKIGKHDTPVFVEDEITYHGQPIAAIIATDHETARRAANAVVVETVKEKAIITVEDAIKANSFIADKFRVHSSLVDRNERIITDWSKYPKTVEGTVKMGGQEHFYLETQQVVVIPHEDDELEIVASTQGVTDVQMEIGHCLDIPAHKIVVKVRRIGGGFGGKESTISIITAPCAIAARKFRRPMRMKLERFDDMAITGNRHPYTFNYKAAIDDNRKIKDLQVEMYSNGGHTLDLSIGVLTRAMTHVDNVYRIGNVDVVGRICKTNTASNTAFRGFGGPQGMFCMETVIAHLAEQFNIDYNELRENNFYEEGDKTPFGMKLEQCNAQRCWYECKEKSHFDHRKKKIDEFNKKSKYVKRGIYLLPTKFGIAFGLKHMNQGGALVHVYTDGSILVSHGGMEMGQGLHTKIVQIAAKCLNVPVDKIFIHETSTDKVPNTSPTAASVGSDLNGLAVQDACERIMERLEPIRKEFPDKSWDEWVKEAFMRRISLSSTGFAIIPCDTVDYNTGKGEGLYAYCVYGTACCEVEVDCLSGDHRLLQTDIVMDIGDSLNPAVDIGQIEGAFIQGYGLFTMEQIKIRGDGTRLTRGPGTYKIPTADDAPRAFHVYLLQGSSNKMAIFSSKVERFRTLARILLKIQAVGEPPLFLGCCVLFAIRQAIRSYRQDKDLTGYFRLDSPLTAERIRMACDDQITKRVRK
ncbi:hypothetical protein WR25_02114 isoform B [Diploscapter pachys]|uniref:xanthine dehydrogenase n=1 Tax=Diploscapter pachys TaxID=2018661 RepID=A0A2A2L571_9BILA|nr:hypothetical protein WR25_02114 isoform B [Diploscapter pachys]